MNISNLVKTITEQHEHEHKLQKTNTVLLLTIL